MAHRLMIAVLIGGLAVPHAQTEEHLVAVRQVRDALSEAASRRGADLARLDGLFSTPEARRASDGLGVDLARARGALPSLTDAELRDLAARVESLEEDPVAGHWIVWLEILVILLLTLVVAFAMGACSGGRSNCI